MTHKLLAHLQNMQILQEMQSKVVKCMNVFQCINIR